MLVFLICLYNCWWTDWADVLHLLILSIWFCLLHIRGHWIFGVKALLDLYLRWRPWLIFWGLCKEQGTKKRAVFLPEGEVAAATGRNWAHLCRPPRTQSRCTVLGSRPVEPPCSSLPQFYLQQELYCRCPPCTGSGQQTFHLRPVPRGLCQHASLLCPTFFSQVFGLLFDWSPTNNHVSSGLAR